eukprot:m.261893 g.261893  ORF g.261893 m.261893 type:complete len:317 (+) comp43642_c0_seq1:196-1146(+)
MMIDGLKLIAVITVLVVNPWSVHVSAMLGPPFDSEWIRSDSTVVNLTMLNNETVRWTKPKKPSVIMTYFPVATSIANAGDVFKTVFAWRSDGQNKCDPFDWQDGKTCSCGQQLKETCAKGKGTPTCAKTSVNCIEGTGDFRIALWDTSTSSPAPPGRSVTARPEDDFCPSGDDLHTCMDEIGKHFREYHFRTMPHVSTTYFHPSDSEPGGFYAKTNGSNETFCDHRLAGHWGHTPSGVFPGFGVPRGQWVNMELVVARYNTTTYNVSITMATVQYDYLHTWPTSDASDMPQSIGALGIWFPNSRAYDYVDLAKALM